MGSHRRRGSCFRTRTKRTSTKMSRLGTWLFSAMAYELRSKIAGYGMYSRIRHPKLAPALLACGTLLPQYTSLADTIPVRHAEGLMHGFLLLENLEGKAIADGQMTQEARGDRVTSHLTFKFKDGSTYEDTTVFSQRGAFRLLNDHVIAKGPSFKQP